MDLHLSREQEMFRKMYRDFTENEVKPLVEWVDENGAFPEETVEEMAKLGMMGIYLPKEYSGTGAGVLSCVMAVEEMSKVYGTTSVVIFAHTSLCCASIYESGTEEQRKYYLSKLCPGEWIGAFGLTEPDADTDAQDQQTTTVLDEKGGSWILNGSKIFITNVGYASAFVILAITGVITDECGRKKKEVSVFIVECTDPGFPVGKHEKKMGIEDPSICELIMEDCIIPKDRLLDRQGKGFGTAMEALDDGRIDIASRALGLAKGAAEETIKYTKEYIQFGWHVSQFQNTQFRLADMHAKVEAVKWLAYFAAMKKEDHEPYTVDAAMVRLMMTETVSDVICRCMQLFGGYDYTREYPMERMMHDVKITEIYEGTNEVQHVIISINLDVS